MRQPASLCRRWAVTAGVLAAAASARADPYSAWSHLVADEAARQDDTACAVMLIAAAQVAMAEADNFVEPRFASRLLVRRSEPLGLPVQAVVASAAHHVLATTLPTQRERLDRLLAQQLEGVKPATQRDAAAIVGASIAQVVMVGLDAHSLLASLCPSRPPGSGSREVDGVGIRLGAQATQPGAASAGPAPVNTGSGMRQP